jgi:hypothetical protein
VARARVPAEHLDGLTTGQPPDPAAVIAAWRRAEARVYPSVMTNVTLYQQYIGVVRAVVDELGDAHSEEELLDAWTQRREIGSEVVRRLAPSMATMMDADAVRDAAFATRHREITREQGKELARRRLEEARRRGDEWVVLFEDVTPLGSQRLEMHVRSGRALHASSRTEPDALTATYELEVVQLDPASGTWLLDRPPLMPARSFRDADEWEARVQQARATFGREP